MAQNESCAWQQKNQTALPRKGKIFIGKGIVPEAKIGSDEDLSFRRVAL
jgi:hypothetical protein